MSPIICFSLDLLSSFNLEVLIPTSLKQKVRVNIWKFIICNVVIYYGNIEAKVNLYSPGSHIYAIKGPQKGHHPRDE